MNKCEVGAMHS